METLRRFDDLGRIVIPKGIRDKAFEGSFQEGLLMEISCAEDGTILLKRAIPCKQQLLTPSEINAFNAYIEDAKMDDAFGNTDWVAIYHKIVGNMVSDYAQNMMDRYVSDDR